MSISKKQNWLASEEIAFRSKAADKLGTDVDTETLSITYTWKYEKNGVEKDIPGKFTSSHRSYLIVGPPQSPWDVSAAATRPWIGALDYAVTWAKAAGANDSDGCAVAVTEEINGGVELKYDTTGGAPNYGMDRSVGFVWQTSFYI